ncbi:hypothetical protein D9M72_477340 [compost metagenome]
MRCSSGINNSAGTAPASCIHPCSVPARAREAGLLEDRRQPCNRREVDEAGEAQIPRHLPGQRGLPHRCAPRPLGKARSRDGAKAQLRQPQQRGGERQHGDRAQRGGPPGAQRMVQRHGHGRRDASGGDHRQRIAGRELRHMVRKVSFQQAGQQHVGDGDRAADHAGPRIERRHGAGRAHGDTGKQKRQRREEHALQAEPVRKGRSEWRHQREREERKRRQQAGLRGVQRETLAHGFEQGPERGDRCPKAGRDEQDAGDEKRGAGRGVSGLRRMHGGPRKCGMPRSNLVTMRQFECLWSD